MPIKEIGRKHGFSNASFYKRRSKYGGINASNAKRLREPELESGKLKRLLAEAHLDIHALKSVFGTKLVIQALAPQVKREALSSIVNCHQLPARHACALVGLSQDSYRHAGTPDSLNEELCQKIVQTAHTRRRWRLPHESRAFCARSTRASITSGCSASIRLKACRSESARRPSA